MDPGIYIKQNTIVRGGDGQLGKKLKLGAREKKKNGKEKRRKIILKKGKKGLRNASFWAAANLFVGGKNESQERGGGEMIRMHNIYPWRNSCSGRAHSILSKYFFKYTLKIPEGIFFLPHWHSLLLYI